MDDELLREVRPYVAAHCARAMMDQSNNAAATALLARIDARLASGGWIKASEMLPDSGVDVEISDGEKQGFGSLFRGHLWNYDRDYEGGTPIKWRHFPALPKGEA